LRIPEKIKSGFLLLRRNEWNPGPGEESIAQHYYMWSSSVHVPGLFIRSDIVPLFEPVLQESISTCRFAQRVALIKNEAVLNEELDPALVSHPRHSWRHFPSWRQLPSQSHTISPQQRDSIRRQTLLGPATSWVDQPLSCITHQVPPFQVRLPNELFPCHTSLWEQQWADACPSLRYFGCCSTFSLSRSHLHPDNFQLHTGVYEGLLMQASTNCTVLSIWWIRNMRACLLSVLLFSCYIHSECMLYLR